MRSMNRFMLGVAVCAMTGTCATLANAAVFVDTGFENIASGTDLSSSYKETVIDGNTWATQTGGGTNYVKISSFDGSNRLALEDWTGTTYNLPKAVVRFGSAENQVDVSALSVDFDFYYNNSLPTSNNNALTIYLHGGTTTPTISLTKDDSNGLVQSAWLHFNLVTSDSGYSFTVTNNGAAVMSGSGALTSSGPVNAADVVFELAPYGTGTGAVYLDNVLIQAIPEPASLSAVGLGALLLVRRRKSSVQS